MLLLFHGPSPAWPAVTSQALSAFATSGAAAFVEFIEALTVVLAVGAARGWRSALGGAAAALAFLAVLAAVFGPALGSLPLGPAKLVIGLLLVLFGLRWLRKATRRAAGIIPLRDEAAAFFQQRDRVGRIAAAVAPWDGPGLAASFQATAVEGLEVIFIVVAIGAGGADLPGPPVLGAVAALVLVVVIGALLHRPITRMPENTLKRLVGAMLAGLGTFWVGEGAGLAWPGDDLSMVPLGAAYLLLSVAAAAALRRRGAVQPS